MAEDLIGHRFGRLVVKYEVPGGTASNSLYSCKCRCGNYSVVDARRLREGHTESCGCNRHRTGPAAYNWRGHGEIGRTFWNSIRSNARFRGIAFDLTIEDAWTAFVAQ